MADTWSPVSLMIASRIKSSNGMTRGRPCLHSGPRLVSFGAHVAERRQRVSERYRSVRCGSGGIVYTGDATATAGGDVSHRDPDFARTSTLLCGTVATHSGSMPAHSFRFASAAGCNGLLGLAAAADCATEAGVRG